MDFFFPAYIQEQEAATFSPPLETIEKNLCFMEMGWGEKTNKHTNPSSHS